MSLLIEIETGKEKALRKKLRKESRYKLVLRKGRYYIVMNTIGCQPNTIKQLYNKSIFAKANKMAIRDMQREGRAYYWCRRARREGYKTAMGSARAHYIELLKKRYIRQSDKKIEAKVNEAIKHEQQRITVRKEVANIVDRRNEIYKNIIFTLNIISIITLNTRRKRKARASEMINNNHSERYG